jgi:CheY-like chemotaxis protein
MKVDVCKSGMEAIEIVQTKRYDLVLMDHMMPVMDGVEAAGRIRNMDIHDPHYGVIPVIALTANAISGTKEMFLENGFNDFLSKPVDIVKLDAILEKWIPNEKQIKISREYGVDLTVSNSCSTQDTELEGLDIKKGIALSGGSIERYNYTLSIFLQDCIEKKEEIRKCLETENLPLYTIYVHALKSAAANVAALELSGLAKELEAAGKREDIVFIRTHNEKLMSSLELLIGNISNYLKPGKQEEPVDIVLLKTGLARLKNAIERVNPRAIKAAVKEIQPFTKSADAGGVVENILMHTLVGEYDEAVSLISFYLISR